MKGITDIHCHLLPSLDDGANTWGVSWRMALAAASSGVKQIICTPHCSAEDPKLVLRIAKIRQAVDIMNRIFIKGKIPIQVFPGMELLCNEGLRKIVGKSPMLTLAGSRYLLIEFSFEERLSYMEWAVERIRCAGYFPVLAHPERYAAVQRNPNCLKEWFQQGYVLQIDKGSVLGEFGAQCTRTACWALNRGLIHIAASDAHNAETRTASFSQLEDFLTQRYSSTYADLLLRKNPGRIIENRELVGI